MILVLDPAVSLEIWMAKARFLARSLQTTRVYIKDHVSKVHETKREWNTTKQKNKKKQPEQNKTLRSNINNESIFYVFIKILLDGKDSCNTACNTSELLTSSGHVLVK